MTATLHRSCPGSTFTVDDMIAAQTRIERCKCLAHVTMPGSYVVWHAPMLWMPAGVHAAVNLLLEYAQRLTTTPRMLLSNMVSHYAAHHLSTPVNPDHAS